MKFFIFILTLLTTGSLSALTTTYIQNGEWHQIKSQPFHNKYQLIIRYSLQYDNNQKPYLDNMAIDIFSTNENELLINNQIQVTLFPLIKTETTLRQARLPNGTLYYTNSLYPLNKPYLTDDFFQKINVSINGEAFSFSFFMLNSPHEFSQRP